MTPRRETPGLGAWLRATVAVVALLLGVAASGAPAYAAEAAATPHWRLESHAAPTNLPLHGEGVIVVTASNLGDAEVNGRASTVTLLDSLPASIESVSRIERKSRGTSRFLSGHPEEKVLSEAFLCNKEKLTPPEPLECTFAANLAPYEQLELIIYVKTKGTPSDEANKVSVENGGAPREEINAPVKVNGDPTSFGVESYELTPENEEFEPDVEAGSHPFQLTTTFNLNQTLERYAGDPQPQPSAPALDRNLSFKLPPGLLGDANVVGNPNAPQECSGLDFGVHGESDLNACPEDTAVGVASVEFTDPITLYYANKVVPVFNLVPAQGEPARFGFEVNNVPIILDTSVRTGDDYGVTVSVRNASQAVQVLSSRVTFWGVPEDVRHNDARGWECLGDGSFVELLPSEPRCGNSGVAQPAAFLTLPTKCGEVGSQVEGDAWNGETLKAANGSTEIENESPTTLSGCEDLLFEPTIEVKPAQEAASTPTGMTVKVTLPQQGTLEADGKAEADVKSTTLELEGLQASPGAASGLASCSAAQVGFNSEEDVNFSEGLQEAAQTGNDDFSSLPASCPEEAKIGTVSIKTPLLEEEVTGSVYLASQDTDPFASPLVLYIVAKEPKSEVLVKLAGEVQINPTTGQLTSVFKETPQTPFESLTLHLSNTERASQETPAFCKPYYSHATFSSWSSEVPAKAESEFQITSGPNGTPCPGAQLPFATSFKGGPVNTQAGAFTPFTVTIGRPDGNQALEAIDMELPPGLAALISQVEECSEAQAEANACPAGSLVGHTTSVSGLGGKPVSLGGQLYFTGPLKQTSTHAASPFGLLAVTHAKAGPFDLGYVKVFSTINVNETTAAAIVKSEPIPDRLDGVPVELKALNVTVERPGGAPFQFNPTHCEGLSITGKLTGYEGASSSISESVPISNCGALSFKPTLTATVLGHGSKANGTTFKVTLESAGLGQANVHKVDLTLPEVLPSRLTTIQKACLAAVFEANPAACDEGSDIGEGIVYTPVFKNPLRGPAYLVSHGNAAFPDVEFVLQGEGVTLIVDGKTDIKKGITYSKFETAPDAPFTKFETILPAGPHSALTANVPEAEEFSLCKHASSLVMPTTIVGQNGAPIEQTTKIALIGCGGVLGATTKKLSRAQKLAKALTACRSKYKGKAKKSKRIVCEKQARKKYGPLPKKAKKSAKKKT
ncbi:MAG: hypothetical protein ABR992_06330 [Solirubrobacteraceae bacterium]